MEQIIFLGATAYGFLTLMVLIALSVWAVHTTHKHTPAVVEDYEVDYVYDVVDETGAFCSVLYASQLTAEEAERYEAYEGVCPLNDGPESDWRIVWPKWVNNPLPVTSGWAYCTPRSF